LKSQEKKKSRLVRTAFPTFHHHDIKTRLPCRR
jgi:hypothetical protein